MDQVGVEIDQLVGQGLEPARSEAGVQGGGPERLVVRGERVDQARRLGRRGDATGARAERIIELATMVERLERVMESDYIPVWLRKPIPMLDEEKPLDLIGRGDYRRVGQVISGLEDPGAS